MQYLGFKGLKTANNEKLNSLHVPAIKFIR